MSEDNLTLDEFGGQMLASEMPVEISDKIASDLAPVFDVPVNISAVLGRAHMSVAQLLQLGQGSILELDRKVGEAIDIYVNNRLVARGEVVVVDERQRAQQTDQGRGIERIRRRPVAVAFFRHRRFRPHPVAFAQVRSLLMISVMVTPRRFSTTTTSPRATSRSLT